MILSFGIMRDNNMGAMYLPKSYVNPYDAFSLMIDTFKDLKTAIEWRKHEKDKNYLLQFEFGSLPIDDTL